MPDEIPRLIPDPTPLPIVQQIEQYIVAHPRCTRSTIAEAIGAHIETVGMSLTRLRRMGRVRPVRVSYKKVRLLLWEEGVEEGLMAEGADGMPRQTTVTTWTPHMQRDPLVALFFSKPDIDNN